MIDKKVINSIYRIHSRVPKDISDLKIDEMMNSLAEFHTIILEEDYLILEDIKDESPFKRIPIKKIYGIEYFDKSIAIVLPTCIIFFNRNDDGVNIHIKMPKLSLIQRLKLLFYSE